MIRQSDLTWTSAPPSFWSRLGYSAESARRAQGKWVVARAEAIRHLVDSLDPAAAVRALAQLGPDDLVSVSTVPDGRLQGQRVLRFNQGGRKQEVYLTPGVRPRLLRISSWTGSARTDLDFVDFPTHVRVVLPDAADVFAPQLPPVPRSKGGSP